MLRHETKISGTLEKISNNALYSMRYDGNYGFDNLLEIGASTDGKLVRLVTGRFLKGLPFKFPIPNLGCSTFNAWTKEGDYTFGRNFGLAYSPALIVETTPNHGYRFLPIVNLVLLDFGEDSLPDSLREKLIVLAAPYTPSGGTNEKGLAVAVLRIVSKPTNQDAGKMNITTTTTIRLMLDKAVTVDEVVGLLEQYDIHSFARSCYHSQTTGAGGNSAVMEYVDNESAALKAGQDYQIATNFLSSDKKYNFGDDQDRHEILKTSLDSRNGVVKDEQAGTDLL